MEFTLEIFLEVQINLSLLFAYLNNLNNLLSTDLTISTVSLCKATSFIL